MNGNANEPCLLLHDSLSLSYERLNNLIFKIGISGIFFITLGLFKQPILKCMLKLVMTGIEQGLSGVESNLCNYLKIIYLNNSIGLEVNVAYSW